MKKLNTYLILLVLSAPLFTVSAQNIGINTNNPTATLDILTETNSKADNALLIKNSDGKSLLNIKNNGYVGVSTSNPDVLLDLRGTGENAAIGIGTTDLDAATAGEGAVRYNPNIERIEYSDGTRWIIMDAEIPKATVLAQNWTIPVALPDTTSVNLGSWTETMDKLNNFDHATGVFTAPRDGVYSATFSVNLFRARIRKVGSQLQAEWKSSTGQSSLSVSYFMNITDFTIPRQGYVLCSATFSLKKGEKLWPVVYQNTGLDRRLRVDETGDDSSSRGFNNLFIVEH